ncbi:hypothetical protein LMP03_14335, partial [Staphylococcus aureus]|uniref:hypothetical protein n=1 Tax=Staphylococcus aureus TaxID=1280 RepID=UPI001E3D0E12
AIDVLLTNVAERLGDLERWSVEHRDVFDAFFDRRLFEIDLFRMAPRTLHDGIHPIYRTSAPEGKRTKPVKDILGSMWC